MRAEPSSTIKIFYSYAHEDQTLRDALEKYLKPLKRQGQISEWHDHVIQAGIEWAHEIDTHLSTCDIVLLLISPDFLNSDYCWSVEMQHALERHKTGEARVIPIILRHCDWQPTPIGELQALPHGGKPITSWTDPDEAFTEVAKRIRDVVTNLLVQRGDPQTIYALATSGSPALHDRLDRQTSHQWSEEGQVCLFEKGAYHIYVQGHNCFLVGLAEETDFSNFAFQVEMTIVEGDAGGIVFRAGQNNSHGYRFGAGLNYLDCMYESIILTRSRADKVQLNRACLLTAIARGSSILLFVNKKCVASIVDTSASSGKIGLMAVNFTRTDRAHVVYRNAQVWKLTNGSQWL